MVINKADKIELQRIAKEKNITYEEAVNIIEGMYEFIREKAQSINYIEKEFSKEEFDNLKTNFNIPCIGKLCAAYNVYKKINKIK